MKDISGLIKLDPNSGDTMAKILSPLELHTLINISMAKDIWCHSDTCGKFHDKQIYCVVENNVMQLDATSVDILRIEGYITSTNKDLKTTILEITTLGKITVNEKLNKESIPIIDPYYKDPYNPNNYDQLP